MNKKEQELFIAFFEQIFEAEQEFQSLKKKLQACQHYNPYLLFQHIVRDGQGEGESGPITITIAAMRQYLAERTSCNERELYEIFEKFDHQRLGVICEHDFVAEVTPLGETAAGNRPGKISAQVQGHFLALINECLKRFRILQVLRKEIHFIWPYNAFAEIDNFKTGHIGHGELQSFFYRNDYNISEQQIQLLLHGLKRRCYRQVNLQVFCQNIEPLEFNQYEAYKAYLEQQKQQEFLKRSRREEQTMRRSRIQSWKVQHGIAKEQRRRKAQKQRELELEERINKEIHEHEKQKERYVRRAILEQDKNIRWNVEAGAHVLQLEKQRLLEQKLRNEDLNIIRNQQNQVKNVLVRSALRREQDLQNSRRVRLNLERERQLAELEYQRELEVRQLERQRIINEDLERQRELQRRQLAARQNRERLLAQQLERKAHSQRHKFISEVEASRRIYQQQLRLERERAQREYELERIRNQDYNRTYESATGSRRIADLERELQMTRTEIRERQSRLNLGSNSKRQPETADREYRGAYRS